LKVVLDPNVLISSLISKGVTAQVVDAWLVSNTFDVVACSLLVAELEGVLAREKFAGIDAETRRGLIDRVRIESDSFDDPVLEIGVTRDPGDDYLIALARASHATFLVSGDKDLHAANAADVNVVTPAAFWAIISADDPRQVRGPQPR
jgi:putative PIN family toxin of toxin-antitoxin system